jgi:DNA-directed RNA polymerase I subunit RPA43
MKRKGSTPPVGVDSSPKRARKGKENDEFCSVKTSIVLSVPPVFANRLRYGVEEMLDTMIMRCAYTSPSHLIFLLFSHCRRYEPTLNGVVLAHSDVHFLDRVARLQADSPFAICHVGFDALIWKPTRGMKLSASIHRAFLLAPSYHNSSTGEGEERARSLPSLLTKW